MSLHDSKAAKVIGYYEAARRDGLLDKMNPHKRELVEAFVRDYRASQAPEEALRDYYLKLAPIERTFARTKELEKGMIALLEGACLGAGNTELVLAETGAWVLADGEEGSLGHLKALHAAYVRFFGATPLPPAYKKEAVAEQESAHLKARRDKPAMPPGQKLHELRAGRRDLTEQCDEAFAAYHDFLDGYFGRRGDEAFAEKAKYGYDRRSGRYQAPREKARTQPAVVPAPAPGPVASGGEAAPPAPAGGPAADDKGQALPS